jgi:hypothetical protein
MNDWGIDPCRSSLLDLGIYAICLAANNFSR